MIFSAESDFFVCKCYKNKQFFLLLKNNFCRSCCIKALNFHFHFMHVTSNKTTRIYDVKNFSSRGTFRDTNQSDLKAGGNFKFEN